MQRQPNRAPLLMRQPTNRRGSALRVLAALVVATSALLVLNKNAAAARAPGALHRALAARGAKKPPPWDPLAWGFANSPNPISRGAAKKRPPPNPRCTGRRRLVFQYGKVGSGSIKAFYAGCATHRNRVEPISIAAKSDRTKAVAV